MAEVLLKWIYGTLIVAVVLFYPLLISMYVFIPLLIGLAGYFFMIGLYKEKPLYVALSTLYFVNLEVNLSLPLFLMVMASLSTYFLFAKKSILPKGKCRACKAIYITFLVDIIYFVLLFSYDLVFQTTSIVVDSILLYSLLFDLLAVVIL
jgi:hypothetical protein